MVLLRRKAVLAVALESVVGTPETLTQTDVVAVAYEPEVQFSASVNPRMRMADFGQYQQVPGLREASATFSVDLNGDGAGTTPAWAELLLPACGMQQSVDTWTFASQGPSNAGPVRTVTIGLYQDGRLKLGAGCAGNFVINGEAGLPMSVEFTFMGKWIDVTDAPMLDNPTAPQAPFRFANVPVALGGWNPCLQSMSIDAGNNLINRECNASTDSSGLVSGMITDRLSLCTVNPEAALVATNDTYGQWWSATEVAIQADLDDGTDLIVIQGTGQLQDVQDGDRNGILIDDCTYQFNDDSLRLIWGSSPP